MPLSPPPDRRRDTEDALRSLGSVLDAVGARSILIRESDGGLLVRARVAASPEDLDGRWTSLERRLTADDLERYRREAVARRESGHVAGPHERVLRMIGRRIDDDGLTEVTLIQHWTEGSWLLWHGAGTSAGPALVVLEDDRLLIEDAHQAATRRAREALPAGEPASPGTAAGDPPGTVATATAPVPGRPPARPLARLGRRDRLDDPRP